MKKNQSLWEDPVVREVRETRRKLWEQAGGTIEGLLHLLDQRVPKKRKKRAKNA